MIAIGGHSELANGVCDFQFNNEKCCFDGGDCSTCPSCPNSSRVNDGFCDEDLLNEQCCFDLGDCKGMKWFMQACVSECIVPGLSKNEVKILLENEICDKPLNKTECCFDNGACLAAENACNTCTFDTNKVPRYLQGF